MSEPITVHEAAEAICDMVGTAANIASHLVATDWQLNGNRFVVKLQREHNGNTSDQRDFVVEVWANMNNPVSSPPVNDAKDDMAVLLDEAGLLLLTATGYDHDNKQMLIEVLKMLRGQKGTGWTIDIKEKTIQKS